MQKVEGSSPFIRFKKGTVFLLFVAYDIVIAVRAVATLPPARAFFALMIAAGIAGLVWHKAAPRYLQSDVLATLCDSARSKQLASRTVLATSAGMMLSTVLVGSVVTWFCICSAAVFGPVAFLWAIWLYKQPVKRANFYSRLGVYWLCAWFG